MRKTAICPRVTELSGQQFPAPQPPVIASTARDVRGAGGRHIGPPVLAYLRGRYQTSQRFSCGGTIADPAGQANAFWNSGRFDNGPITRYLAIGCGSPCTIVR